MESVRLPELPVKSSLEKFQDKLTDTMSQMKLFGGQLDDFYSRLQAVLHKLLQRGESHVPDGSIAKDHLDSHNFIRGLGHAHALLQDVTKYVSLAVSLGRELLDDQEDAKRFADTIISFAAVVRHLEGEQFAFDVNSNVTKMNIVTELI
eukprot:5846110-Pyramimonas_sp.AAC.1